MGIVKEERKGSKKRETGEFFFGGWQGYNEQREEARALKIFLLLNNRHC